VVDAAPIHQLIGASGVLEQNSCYAYLLLTEHFADTCLVAVSASGSVCGCVLAYRPPTRPQAVFVWQVGVDGSARRQGLGRRLLHELIALPGCAGVRFLEATVTRSNVASRRLFQGFAHDLGVSCRVGKGFPAALFAGGGHEDEDLFRIGPWGRCPVEAG
jgi:L-2,4-diaminobutyric acid acetyltransferase